MTLTYSQAETALERAHGDIRTKSGLSGTELEKALQAITVSTFTALPHPLMNVFHVPVGKYVNPHTVPTAKIRKKSWEK